VEPDDYPNRFAGFPEAQQGNGASLFGFVVFGWLRRKRDVR